MLTAVAISNYRSLRKLIVPLKGLNVITGANGSGKSSFYRALRLLADTAQGRVVPSLAREGGLQSTLWAGPESISRRMRQGEIPVQGTSRKQPVNLRLGFAGDEFGYLIVGFTATRKGQSIRVLSRSRDKTGVHLAWAGAPSFYHPS